jgi:hypothetical protein
VKVYVVSSGCKYEGVSIRGIFSTRDLAFDFAQMVMVKIEEDHREENIVFKESAANSWESDMEYCNIVKWEVDAVGICDDCGSLDSEWCGCSPLFFEGGNP